MSHRSMHDTIIERMFDMEAIREEEQKMENKNVPFCITAENFGWLNGAEDDPQDLCLHGRVTVQVGEEVLQDDCCVSASALQMLRTLTEDHEPTPGEQMLPCCGHSMYPGDSMLNTVFISGCDNGTDYAVRHDGIDVYLITQKGTWKVSLLDYRQQVLHFAMQVQEFYRKSSPKQLPKNPVERDGYLAFWREWGRRMP